MEDSTRHLIGQKRQGQFLILIGFRSDLRRTDLNKTKFSALLILDQRQDQGMAVFALHQGFDGD